MLKEQLQKELNEALKTGNQLKRSVLAMAVTAIKNKELAKRTQLSKTITNIEELETKSLLSDQEILGVIAGEVKKRKEAIEQFTAGHRPELATKEKQEMEILLGYLPAQVSEEEIKAEVKKTITALRATGEKDFGKVMAEAMASLKGKTDGAAVSKIVKELLS